MSIFTRPPRAAAARSACAALAIAGAVAGSGVLAQEQEPTEAATKANAITGMPAEPAVPTAATLQCGTMPIAPRAIADFLDRSPEALHTRSIVEKFHFLPPVRRLTGRPKSVMGDLHYVLQHLPNHHQALSLLSKFEVREGSLPRPNAGLRATNLGFARTECYIQRAIRFSPKDPTPHMILGIHFHRKKNYEAAALAYESALKMSPDYAEAHYNRGLLAFDMGDYEGASAAARRASELGYPLSGLRKKLARLGKS